jgi:hypothetical protein
MTLKQFFPHTVARGQIAIRCGHGDLACGNNLREQPFPFTPWCNGNTRDFGSLIQGSSPCGVVFSSAIAALSLPLKIALYIPLRSIPAYFAVHVD